MQSYRKSTGTGVLTKPTLKAPPKAVKYLRCVSNKAELEIRTLRCPLQRPQYREPETKEFIGMSVVLSKTETTLELLMAAARPSTVSSANSSDIHPPHSSGLRVRYRNRNLPVRISCAPFWQRRPTRIGPHGILAGCRLCRTDACRQC